MSSSKSNKELLKFIEYYLTNINESSSKNLEFEIRFGTKAKKAFTKDDIDNVVANNTISRNGDGLKLFKQDSVLYSNRIKDNGGFGLQIDTSQDIYIWNRS